MHAFTVNENCCNLFKQHQIELFFFFELDFHAFKNLHVISYNSQYTVYMLPLLHGTKNSILKIFIIGGKFGDSPKNRENLPDRNEYFTI